MPRTSKYENSNQALKLLCEIIDDAINHRSGKPRELALKYFEAHASYEANAFILVNGLEVDRPPTRLFPELLRTAYELGSIAVRSGLLGEFAASIEDGSKIHYWKIMFDETKSPDELLADLQTLHHRLQGSKPTDQKTDEDRFEFCTHPYLKLACMMINCAVQSKIRHLSFVWIKEYITDTEFRLHVVVDNTFMIPPPSHMWQPLNEIMVMFAKVAREQNLVGEFAYRENYQQEGNHKTAIAHYWDIYFSPNPHRNLGSELITLFLECEKPIQVKLEEMRLAETNKRN